MWAGTSVLISLLFRKSVFVDLKNRQVLMFKYLTKSMTQGQEKELKKQGFKGMKPPEQRDEEAGGGGRSDQS